MPAKNSGAIDVARSLALENLKIFNECNVDKCDFILVDCASCGAMLKSYKDLFDENSVEYDYFNNLKDKVLDINEFMVKVKSKLPSILRELVVTYHDPCHLKRSQGI